MSTEYSNVLTEREAAKYIGISPSTLRLWRSSDRAPKFFRAGKLVRFRRSDLDSWIEERLNQPVGIEITPSS